MSEKKAAKKPIYAIVRYSDNVAPKEGTISAHGKVLKEHGYVWVGKFGKTMGQVKMARLLSQIKKDIDTYLFLVRSVKGDQNIIVARLVDIQKYIPPEELDKVPQYYRGKKRFVGVWFKVTEFWEGDIQLLRSLIVSSSGMFAFHALSGSMAGMFFVKPLEDFSLSEAKLKKLSF